MTSSNTPAEAKPGPDHKTYSIHIDKDHFKVEQHVMTGAELRALPNPPIPASRDLLLVVPGGLDKVVEDGDQIDIKDGLHLVTAPREVTPGANRGR